MQGRAGQLLDEFVGQLAAARLARRGPWSSHAGRGESGARWGQARDLRALVVRGAQPGRLTLAVPGWADEQIEEFRSQLRPAGWQVDAADGQVSLGRTAAGLAP